MTGNHQRLFGLGLILRDPIKSIVLYHLDPERLPPRGRYGLYGLYFLSDRDHFGPSKSSEFLTVNDLNPVSDGSIIIRAVQRSLQTPV